MKSSVAPGVSVDDLLKKEDLTVPEAAQLLRSSETLVYKLVNQGELKVWRLTPSKTAPMRIYTDSVIKYAREKQGRKIESKRKR